MLVDISKEKEKIKDLSFLEMVELCKERKFFFAVKNIESYCKEYDVSIEKAIKDIYIDCLTILNTQEELENNLN